MQIKNIKKMVAMTLAEVLVTLIILGTVSALVIPTLKTDADRLKIEGLFKKAYYEIDQAVDFYISEDPEEHDLSKWTYSVQNVFNILSERLNTAAVYNNTSSSRGACFASSYRGALSSTTYSYNDKNCISLVSGISIRIHGCTASACTILVDLNGPQKPNIFGYDAYAFKIDNVDGFTYYYQNGSINWNIAKQIIENDWKIPDTIWN